MEAILQNIDWMEVITVIWTVILLPILTYVGTQLNEWFKAKKIDKYTNILYVEVVNAVKAVSQAVVDDIKDTDGWNEESMNNAKELAKTKAIQSLSSTAYQILKTANEDFDDYLDSLVETALFDIKHDIQ